MYLWWWGCAKTLPLMAEASQAPCCCTAVSNPRPVEYGSCLAPSSLASTPIHEKSLLAQWSGPAEHVTLTVVHSSFNANRQYGEIFLIRLYPLWLWSIQVFLEVKALFSISGNAGIVMKTHCLSGKELYKTELFNQNTAVRDKHFTSSVNGRHSFSSLQISSQWETCTRKRGSIFPSHFKEK